MKNQPYDTSIDHPLRVKLRGSTRGQHQKQSAKNKDFKPDNGKTGQKSRENICQKENGQSKDIWDESVSDGLYSRQIIEDIKTSSYAASPHVYFSLRPLNRLFNDHEHERRMKPTTTEGLNFSLYCSPLADAPTGVDYTVKQRNQVIRTAERIMADEKHVPDNGIANICDPPSSRIIFHQFGPPVSPGLGGRKRRSLTQLTPVQPDSRTPFGGESARRTDRQNQGIEIYAAEYRRSGDAAKECEKENTPRANQMSRSISAPHHRLYGNPEGINSQQDGNSEQNFTSAGREVRHQKPKRIRRIFDSSILEPSPQKCLELIETNVHDSKALKVADEVIYPATGNSGNKDQLSTKSVYRPLIPFEGTTSTERMLNFEKNSPQKHLLHPPMTTEVEEQLILYNQNKVGVPTSTYSKYQGTTIPPSDHQTRRVYIRRSSNPFLEVTSHKDRPNTSGCDIHHLRPHLPVIIISSNSSNIRRCNSAVVNAFCPGFQEQPCQGAISYRGSSPAASFRLATSSFREIKPATYFTFIRN